jgi:phosphatidylethanolamine-binding protein (PEBP) family uncharacterized protein
LALGCSPTTSETNDNTAAWTISSPAFAAGGELPLENTCSGREFAQGINPQFDWSAGPVGTKSYAMVSKHLTIADGDPASPDYFKGFMWAIWDIPANVLSIPRDTGREAFPPMIPGAQQWAIRYQFGYFAPCPNPDPAADPATFISDNYGFTLYALPTEKITLPAKEADVNNYTLTLFKFLEQNNIGKIQLNAVSSAVSGAAPVPVDPATLVYPAGTTTPP